MWEKGRGGEGRGVVRGECLSGSKIMFSIHNQLMEHSDFSGWTIRRDYILLMVDNYSRLKLNQVMYLSENNNLT